MKPRNQSDHLTKGEIHMIKQSFITRDRVPYVANALHCTERTVQKYYAMFRAEGVRQGPEDVI